MLLDDEDNENPEDDGPPRDVSTDVPFLKSIDNSKHENYLGDLNVVNATLRFYAAQVMDALTGEQDKAMSLCQRYAVQFRNIFLGKNKAFSPVPGWNQAGRIDSALSHPLGLADDTANERMEHVFFQFVEELVDAGAVASDPAVLEEQGRGLVDEVVEKYSGLLVGRSLQNQAVLNLGDSDDSTTIESGDDE